MSDNRLQARAFSSDEADIPQGPIEPFGDQPEHRGICLAVLSIRAAPNLKPDFLSPEPRPGYLFAFRARRHAQRQRHPVRADPARGIRWQPPRHGVQSPAKIGINQPWITTIWMK